MPGHLQEGFGCVVTNRFDQLLDDESDPFEILKAAENKKKEAAAAGSTKSAAQAAKQPKKESQKDRKNPLLDKKEESQAAVPLKKEGRTTMLITTTITTTRHPHSCFVLQRAHLFSFFISKSTERPALADAGPSEARREVNRDGLRVSGTAGQV